MEYFNISLISQAIENLSEEKEATNVSKNCNHIKEVAVKLKEDDQKTELIPELNIEESLDDLVDGFESSMSIDLGFKMSKK